MMVAVLKIISDAMISLGLNYGFGEYHIGDDEDAPEIYFVGEYQEITPINEDGMQESIFILTGFSRGSWLALENAKEKIQGYFNKVGGKTVTAENGSAVAIFYGNSLIVPTGDAELKKMQINLDTKEWSVK